LPTLHIHLDESGDFSFTPKGKRYYVFAAAWTFDPGPLAQSLLSLRLDLLKQGHDLPCFHATSDKQENRNAVTQTLARFENWWWVATVIEKAKVNPEIRDPHEFYPKFAQMPLRFILKGRLRDATRVMIFTDRLPLTSQRQQAEKAIKLACRSALPSGISFCSYHHTSASNKWLQVADYCAWAIARKWESNDSRTYDILRSRLALPELDVLQSGATLYYQHSSLIPEPRS
jgi:hypothetical protein